MKQDELLHLLAAAFLSAALVVGSLAYSVAVVMILLHLLR